MFIDASNCGIRRSDKGAYSWMLDRYGDRGKELVLKDDARYEIMGREKIGRGCYTDAAQLWNQGSRRSREILRRIFVRQFRINK